MEPWSLLRHWNSVFFTIFSLVYIAFLLGGGVEVPSNYSQWKVEYASLDKLTNIQASFTKLIEGEFLHNISNQK